MRTKGRRPVLFYGMVIASSALLVFLLFRGFSSPHRPIEYMIAGCLATTLCLLGALIYVVLRQQPSRRRTAPGSARSS